jgi:hypothetical protein
MTPTSRSLHDQIALAESRVRLDGLELKVAVQGLRASVGKIVSGPGGLVAIFLAAAVAGALGARKAASRRRQTRSTRFLA